MLQRLINRVAYKKVNSGLKNMDRGHLLLASGKLALQKKETGWTTGSINALMFKGLGNLRYLRADQLS